MNLEIKIGVQKIEDPLLHYGCKESGLLCWKFKNPVVVVLVIFLKHNGLCGRLVDSNYFHVDEPIPCTNFHVGIVPFACTFAKAC